MGPAGAMGPSGPGRFFQPNRQPGPLGKQIAEFIWTTEHNEIDPLDPPNPYNPVEIHKIVKKKERKKILTGVIKILYRLLQVRADQADQAEVHSHLVPSQGPVHRVSEDPFLKELSVRSVPDPIKEPIKEPSEQWHPQVLPFSLSLEFLRCIRRFNGDGDTERL